MTEVDDKVERVARLAHENGLGGIVIVSQPGFTWLTAGGCNRIDGSRESGNGALLITTDGRRFVIANTIEMPRLLDEELAGGAWQPVEYAWTEEHASPDTIARLARLAAGDGPRIGADWPLPDTLGMDRALARTRAHLTTNEADRYRRLGSDIGRVVGALCRGLDPGLAEQEIARMGADAVATVGARAIVTLVGADDRIARFRHPVATARKWDRMVLLAMCVQRAGLVVALSRIVCRGRPDDDLARRTRATATVFGRLVDATRPGARGRDLFATAQRAYVDVGFPGEEERHHQGGAIGYRSREWVAHPASEEEVQPRQAFAWNPSITGTKIEDTALVDGARVDIITTTPDWPSIPLGTAAPGTTAADILAL